MTSKLPSWIRVRVPAAGRRLSIATMLRASGVHTVCRSAHCPNEAECFSRGTATFMILGDVCSRQCAFCAVGGGEPRPPDPREPARVASAARRMKLAHVVVTSVTRDDLPDRGASAFVKTIRALRKALPRSTVEILVPDFGGVDAHIASVLAAHPDVFNHNVETVRRLQRRIRPSADYERSLSVLRAAARWRPRVVVKSGIMVGLGESDGELFETLADLRAAGCEWLTIGQYLAPSPRHAPVMRYVPPRRFQEYARRALKMGFTAVASGPLVRSSYRAGEMLNGNVPRRSRPCPPR